MNINNLITNYIENNKYFKSSDLINHIVTETGVSKKSISNFVYVSLNRMKNGNDNMQREVTQIKKGIYANQKLSIEEIWKLNNEIKENSKEETLKDLNKFILTGKLKTAGLTFAYDHKFRMKNSNVKTYTSYSYIKSYNDFDLQQIINYTYLEYSKNMSKNFYDIDNLLLRRIVSSINYIDFSKNICVDNFILYLDNNNIDFYKFLYICLKEYKTNLEKKENFKKLVQRKIITEYKVTNF